MCFLISFIYCGDSFAAEYFFIIHLDNKEIKYTKDIYDFNESIEKVQQVYPKEIFKTTIEGIELLVLRADPEKSNLRDLFYLQRIDNVWEGLDYEYATDEWADEVLIHDVDKDSVNEVITVWSGEEEYEIRVNKIIKKNKRLIKERIYSSPSLLIPSFTDDHYEYYDYGRTAVIHNGTALFVYGQQIIDKGSVITINKKSILTINPKDPNKKIYLKPLGDTTLEEWKSFQAERVKK